MQNERRITRSRSLNAATTRSHSLLLQEEAHSLLDENNVTFTSSSSASSSSSKKRRSTEKTSRHHSNSCSSSHQHHQHHHHQCEGLIPVPQIQNKNNVLPKSPTSPSSKRKSGRQHRTLAAPVPVRASPVLPRHLLHLDNTANEHLKQELLYQNEPAPSKKKESTASKVSTRMRVSRTSGPLQDICCMAIEKEIISVTDDSQLHLRMNMTVVHQEGHK